MALYRNKIQLSSTNLFIANSILRIDKDWNAILTLPRIGIQTQNFTTSNFKVIFIADLLVIISSMASYLLFIYPGVLNI